MRKTILAIGIIAALTATSCTDNNKTATVNTQEIIDNLPEAKAADSSLMAYSSQMEQQLQELSLEVEAKKKECDTCASEIQAKALRIQQLRDQANATLQEKRNTYITQLNTKVNDAIKQVAKERGVDQVLYANSVAHTDGPDITDYVKVKLGIK